MIPRPVFVDGYVFGGEDRQDARHRFRPRSIDGANDGVRATREQDLHVRLVREVDISRIERFTGYFALRVNPLDGFAHHCHIETSKLDTDLTDKNGSINWRKNNPIY